MSPGYGPPNPFNIIGVPDVEVFEIKGVSMVILLGLCDGLVSNDPYINSRLACAQSLWHNHDLGPVSNILIPTLRTMVHLVDALFSDSRSHLDHEEPTTPFSKHPANRSLPFV